MRNLSWVLIALAAIALVVAVVAALMGILVLRVTAEGYSNACTNLTLLAIALMMACDRKGSAS